MRHSSAPRPTRRHASVPLAAALLLGGCTLVGQRSFVRDADAPPVITPLPARAGPTARPALVVIGLPTTPDAWTGAVDVAVRLARSRKPDVFFTVESVVNGSAGPAASAAALSRATADAAAVADRIIADGADRLQVELTAGTDPSLRPGRAELRVLVR